MGAYAVKGVKQIPLKNKVGPVTSHKRGYNPYK